VVRPAVGPVHGAWPAGEVRAAVSCERLNFFRPPGTAREDSGRPVVNKYGRALTSASESEKQDVRRQWVTRRRRRRG